MHRVWEEEKEGVVGECHSVGHQTFIVEVIRSYYDSAGKK